MGLSFSKNENDENVSYSNSEMEQKVKNLFYIEEDEETSDLDTLNWDKPSNQNDDSSKKRFEDYQFNPSNIQNGGDLDDVLDGMDKESELKYESLDLTDDLQNLDMEDLNMDDMKKDPNLLDLFGGADFNRSDSSDIDIVTSEVLVGGRKDSDDTSSSHSLSNDDNDDNDDNDENEDMDDSDMDEGYRVADFIHTSSNATSDRQRESKNNKSKKNDDFYTTSASSTEPSDFMDNDNDDDSDSDSDSEKDIPDDGFKKTSSESVNYKTYSGTSELDIRPFSSTDTDNFSFARPSRNY